MWFISLNGMIKCPFDDTMRLSFRSVPLMVRDLALKSNTALIFCSEVMQMSAGQLPGTTCALKNCGLLVGRVRRVAWLLS